MIEPGSFEIGLSGGVYGHHQIFVVLASIFASKNQFLVQVQLVKSVRGWLTDRFSIFAGGAAGSAGPACWRTFACSAGSAAGCQFRIERRGDRLIAVLFRTRSDFAIADAPDYLPVAAY